MAFDDDIFGAEEVANHLYDYATESAPGSVDSDAMRGRMARKLSTDPYVDYEKRRGQGKSTDPWRDYEDRRKDLETNYNYVPGTTPLGPKRAPLDFSSEGTPPDPNEKKLDLSAEGTPVEAPKEAEKPAEQPPPLGVGGQVAAGGKAFAQTAATGLVADPLKAAALAPEMKKEAYDQGGPKATLGSESDLRKAVRTSIDKNGGKFSNDDLNPIVTNPANQFKTADGGMAFGEASTGTPLKDVIAQEEGRYAKGEKGPAGASGYAGQPQTPEEAQAAGAAFGVAGPYRKEIKAREREQAAAQEQLSKELAVPIEQRPLFQAGKAAQEKIEKAIPLTDQEKNSIGGKIGSFIGGVAPALALTAGGALVGQPELGMMLGATQMGMQQAGAAFEKALNDGATPEEAARAAGLNGIVGGALGVIPLHALFDPIRAAGTPILDLAGNEIGRKITPGLMGWLAVKLEQFAKSGGTFVGIGEAQEWLSKQIASEYNASTREKLRTDQAKIQTEIDKIEADPKIAAANEELLKRAKAEVKKYDEKIKDPSKYEVDWERVAISFFGGGVLGTLHPHGMARDMPPPDQWPPMPGTPPGTPPAAGGAAPGAGAGPGGPGAGPTGGAAGGGGTAGAGGAGPGSSSPGAGTAPGGGYTAPPRPPPTDTARQARMRPAFEKGLSDAGVNEPNLPFDELRDLYQTVDGLRTGFGRTDLAGKNPADLKTLFEQLSLLKGHGFTADELRTMSPADVSREYAQAVKEGATAGAPPPEAEPAEPGQPEASMQEKPAGATAGPIPGENQPAATGAASTETVPSKGTRDEPIELATGADVERAAGLARQDHTHPQGEAHNVQQGYGSWNGLHIAFEAPAGGIRRGTNPRTGKPWEGRVGAATGYIVNGPPGNDGDKLDVYFGANPSNPTVYVLDEINKTGGKFRQTKSFIGFDSPMAAVDAYLKTDNKTAEQIGGITPMHQPQFIDWVHNGDHTRPVRATPPEPGGSAAAGDTGFGALPSPAGAGEGSYPDQAAHPDPVGVVFGGPSGTMSVHQGDGDWKSIDNTPGAFTAVGLWPRYYKGTQRYQLYDHTGKLVAQGDVAFVGNEAHIADMQSTAGVSGLRALHDQLLSDHPEVKKIKGLRTGGAGPGRTQEVETPSPQAGEGREPIEVEPHHVQAVEDAITAAGASPHEVSGVDLHLAAEYHAMGVRDAREAFQLAFWVNGIRNGYFTPEDLADIYGEDVAQISERLSAETGGDTSEHGAAATSEGQPAGPGVSAGGAEGTETKPAGAGKEAGVGEGAGADVGATASTEPTGGAETAGTEPITERPAGETGHERPGQPHGGHGTTTGGPSGRTGERPGEPGATETHPTTEEPGHAETAEPTPHGGAEGHGAEERPTTGSETPEAAADLVRKHLEERGAASVGGVDYKIVEGPRNGTFYYTRTEKGVRVEKGGAIHQGGGWTRGKAIDEAVKDAADIIATTTEGKPVTLDALRPAYEALKQEQSGLSTVWIGDIIKRSGLPADEVKKALLKAAKEGKVSLHSSSVTPAEEAKRAGPEGIIRLEGHEPIVTVIFKGKQAEGEKQKIEDVGEKIGGARKDQYAGLTDEDIGQMNAAERARDIIKSKVWPRPDYVDLVENGGVEPMAAALIKQIYDRIATKPRLDDEDNSWKGDKFRRLDVKFAEDTYVTVLRAVRDALADAKNVEQVEAANRKFRADPKIKDNSTMFRSSMPTPKLQWTSPLHIDSDMRRRAEKLVKMGFPNIEPWQRVIKVDDGYNWKTKEQKFFLVRRATGTRFETIPVLNDAGEKVGEDQKGYATREEAEQAARAAYEQMKGEEGKTGKLPTRPHLDKLERIGPDVRNGRDVTGDDFMKDFGFRAVEFGQWVAGDERQRIVNHAYDALHDLARALNIPPKAVSLDGRLAIAFGSRGKGGFAAAHYEPERVVMNMTKITGAGSLAHEWTHALDHYLAEHVKPKPYEGTPRWVSGYHEEPKPSTFRGQYRGKLPGGAQGYQYLGDHNLPHKLQVAVNRVMDALFFRPETEAEYTERVTKKLEGARESLKSWTDYRERRRQRFQAGGNANTWNADRKKSDKAIGQWESEVKRWEGAVNDPKGTRQVVHTDYWEQANKLSGKSGDYWRRPLEMLARATESYVYDKLKAAKHTSQYLVHSVEPGRYAGEGYKGDPYPNGQERKVINALLDRVMQALTTTAGKHGEATKLIGREGELTAEDYAPIEIGPEHVSDDDIMASIEAELAKMEEEAKKPKQERKPREKQEGEKKEKTAKEAGKGAAKAGMSFLDEATAGLSELFGGGKTVGMGINFDKDTYEKAKPFFYRAAAHFEHLLDNLQALAAAITRHMHAVAKIPLDGIREMQVYLAQFVKDIRDGLIKIKQIVAELKAEKASERDRSGSDLGEKGVGEPGEDLAGGNQAGEPGAENLGGKPTEDVGGTGKTSGGEGPGPRTGEQVRGSGEGEHPGGAATDGRPGGGGEGLADDGTGGGRGRPEHASLRSNYHISEPETLIGGTPKVRFGKNRAAIEAYRAITDEGNRDPTKAELDAMAGYTGWGSFGQELFQGTWERPRPAKGWEGEDKWLREHLGADEWKSAQESIINAHYTDPPTVQAMWDMARAMGFTGGRVLEPSMGIGNFFGMMPRDLMEKSDLTGIEMDKLTGGMAKILYPQANVQIKPYQDSMTPDNFYDLAIGNWPFAAEGPVDRRYGALSPTLHDYFYLKTLDQVRPGGIVMGITSAGSMDKVGKQIRIALAKNAELVGAFRLPSGAFEKYAGTKVVTDIIILRKREKPVVNLEDTSWLESSTHKVPSGEIRTNEYWRKYPDRVLGEMDYGHGTTTGRPGMVVRRLPSFGEQLEGLKNRVPKDVYQQVQRGKEPRFEPNNSTDRQGSITIHKNGLYLVSGERLLPLEDVAKYKTSDAKKNEAREHQLKSLVEMRRAYGRLIDAEREGADNTSLLRDDLRRQYEAFVKKHGKVVDSDGLSIMRKLEDPYHPILGSLERPDGSPSRILTESTTRAKKKLESPTVRDALVLQRNASRNLDLDKIAAMAKVPVEQVIKELSEGDKPAIYRTVGGGHEVADVFLSGNVRRKLKGLIEVRDGGELGLDKSIEAIKKVVPENIPYYKIEAKLGATWVPNEDYEQFIGDLLGVKPDPTPYSRGWIQVRFSGARWKVELGRDLVDRPEAVSQWGHPRYRFNKLMRAAMGNQSVKIYDPADRDGGPYFNPEATAEVNDKIAKVREEFQSWAWRDAERKVRFEHAYNDITRAIATPHFDGSFLEFPGMTLRRGDEPFNLRQHQANAIWRGIVNQAGLYAHEVGTGKTYTMAGLAVESRRYGVARKPIIFAHNANSASVAAEFKEMYPGANVLYVDNMAADQIQTTLRRIANEDWDAVVVPHSLVDRFTLSEQTLTSLMAEEIAAMEEAAIEAAREDDITLNTSQMDDPDFIRKMRSPTAKKLVNQRNKIKNKIREHAQRASKEGAIPFEELGIDMMLIDEVQAFKKPPISTSMKVRGLATDVSDRSLGLRFLTGYVKGLNNGRGIHLFTGTPITNSLVEIYNMQRYVMDQEMAIAGVKEWDPWFNTFADADTDVELTAAGEYEPVTRLQSFVNVADLRQMIGQYMDIVFADEMPEFKPREIDGKTMASPDLTDKDRKHLLNGRTEKPIGRPYKKIVNDVGPMSPEQEAALAHLSRLAQEFKNASGKQRRDWMLAGNEHNPVSIETAAANAGLDVRLYNSTAPDHERNKQNRVVKNVLHHYNEHPLATQVIFVDRGHSDTSKQVARDAQGNAIRGLNQEKIYADVPKFNLVKDTIAKLVAGGVKKEEIAVINGSTAKAKRKAIADAMNEGKIRVVIGHRDALGVGVNMQVNLRAMHHMDAPWTPGTLEQANGRGWRQGNKWNSVLEYRYITDRLDGRRWQVLSIKDRFIKDFMHADANLRVIEGDAANIEEDDTKVSDLSKTLSEAAGDPRILIRAKLSADVAKLEKRERLHTYGQADAAGKARQLRERAAREEERDIPKLRADVEKFEAASKDGKFEAIVFGKEYHKRDEANAAMFEIVKGLAIGNRNVPLATVQGFKVDASWLEGFSEPSYMLRSEHIDLGVRPTTASIEGTLRNFPWQLERGLAHIEEQRASAARLEAAAQEPFGQLDTLQNKKQQLRQLEEDLAANPVGAPPWLRQGAPIGARIFVREDWTPKVDWEGKPGALTPLDVSGHLHGDDDYYVLSGERKIPYMKALDKEGMQLYEPHPFRAPPKKAPEIQWTTNDGGRTFTFTQGKFKGEVKKNGQFWISLLTDTKTGETKRGDWATADEAKRKVVEAVAKEPAGGTVEENNLASMTPIKGTGVRMGTPDTELLDRAGNKIAYDEDDADDQFLIDALRSWNGDIQKTLEGFRESYANYPRPERLQQIVTLEKWKRLGAHLGLPRRSAGNDDLGRAEPKPVTAAREIMTPRAMQNIDQIKAAITKHIQDMVGTKVDINIVDTGDLNRDVPGWGSAAFNENRVTSGIYGQRSETRNEVKIPLRGTITLALHNPTALENTANHEAVHALIDLAATDAEVEVIKRERPRNRKIVQEHMDLTDQEVNNIAGFEIDAIAGEIYMGARDYGKPGSEFGFHIALRALFDRLWKLLRQIGNALRGMGFQTSDDIYGKMHRGEMADRPMRETQGINIKGDLEEMGSTAPAAPRIETNELASISMSRRSRRRKRVRTLGELTSEKGTAGVRYWADRMIDVLHIEQEIEAAMGAPLPEHMRPYLADTLYTGRTGERILDVEAKHITPIIDDLKANGISRKDFSDYLYAAHAPVRNRLMARMNPGAPDGLSGMKTVDARGIFLGHDNGPKGPVFRRNAQRVYQMLNEALWTRVNYGLMTPQQAMAWQNDFGPTYVPLRGFEEMEPIPGEGGGGGHARAYSVSGRESREALGRRSEAGDILSQSVLQAAQAINRGEKNRVANTVEDLARHYPNPDMWTVSNTETIRVKDPHTGMVTTKTVPVDPRADNVIVSKKNGRQQAIIIHRPLVARALKGIGVDDAADFVKWMRPLTRGFSRLRTTYNPEFILKNYQRDQFDASAAVLASYGPKGVAWYGKNMPHALQGSFDVVLRGVHSTRWSALYDRFRLAGGKITWVKHQEIEGIIRDIEARMKEGNVKKALLSVPRAIEHANEMLENATRMNLFATAVHHGASDTEAASFAREGTINFDRKGAGSMAQFMAALFPFFGANTQATYRFVRLLRRAPIAATFATAGKHAIRLAMVGMMMGGVVMTLYNHYMGGNNEARGKSYWHDVPEYEKLNNIIFMTGASDSKGKPVYVKVPMFSEGMLPWRAGELAAEVMTGERSVGYAAGQLWDANYNMIPGLGSSHMGLPAIPAIPLSIKMNENTFGGRIHPDPSYFSHEVHEPKSQVKFPTTGAGWQTAAEFLGNLGGGDQYRRPVSLLDLHPEDVRYIATEVWGGFGSFIAGGAGLLQRFISGVAPTDIDVRDYPVLRQYWGHNYDVQISRDFTQARQEALDAAEAQRRGDKRPETHIDATGAGRFTGASKTMSGLNKQEAFVRADKTLGLAEIEKKISDLERRKSTIRAEALRDTEKATEAARAVPSAPPQTPSSAKPGTQPSSQGKPPPILEQLRQINRQKENAL